MARRDFLCCITGAGAAGLTGCVATRGQALGTGGDEVLSKPPNPGEIGCCGADCGSCDVRKATVHGDGEARARAVKVWTVTAQQHWGMQTLDPEVLDCTGCRTTERKHQGHGRCPMLTCAQSRGLASCGLCADWKQCGFLAGVFADEPGARERLQAIADGGR